MPASPPTPLDTLLREIRACTVCAAHLPHGPRPVVRASTNARILIVGQAPGARVHASGIPWNDASGKRLRTWLDVDDTTFYDETQFAIVPMGFCYPGKGKSGDLPPRPECAPLWLDRVLALMPHIELTLLIGQYAQRHFLAERRKESLADTVAAWRDYAPAVIALPHPSPRNVAWFVRHPWFDGEILPMLRARVGELLADGATGALALNAR
ncbi:MULTISPECIES: uracil-DNA glycosylase family protein [Paraburkholderia]|uniref:uracil-DNA glycosylase family protein n=1 Tax=Paraburkholderia TaxID=1822464 RepID=UPI00225BC853|nr:MULTISPECIES: uracil-DNA glycosylase family protein [Paraburkholderia]MCX4160079.1 uracil-DNA glycosylase family protein [Paraburkholderia megapolitana]MDN7155579.1 uracil-DNA glycosylase family protein [Paraburkholderia sp. CHISQ3]MDQ6492623.1 uracil-DNA glycosylase family protein [Paraburkholderia megapolitana]